MVAPVVVGLFAITAGVTSLLGYWSAWHPVPLSNTFPQFSTVITDEGGHDPLWVAQTCALTPMDVAATKFLANTGTPNSPNVILLTGPTGVGKSRLITLLGPYLYSGKVLVPDLKHEMRVGLEADVTFHAAFHVIKSGQGIQVWLPTLERHLEANPRSVIVMDDLRAVRKAKPDDFKQFGLQLKPLVEQYHKALWIFIYEMEAEKFLSIKEDIASSCTKLGKWYDDVHKAEAIEFGWQDGFYGRFELVPFGGYSETSAKRIASLHIQGKGVTVSPNQVDAIYTQGRPAKEDQVGISKLMKKADDFVHKARRAP